MHCNKLNRGAYACIENLILNGFCLTIWPRFIKFIKRSRYTIVKQMKVNYALNHDWYETSLLPQAVLNYVMSIDFIIKKSVQLKAKQFCILTKMKKSV